MTFDSINPFTGIKLNTYNYFTDSEIQLSIDTLYKSHLKFSRLTIHERQTILKPLAQRMRDRQYELARLITLEMGKPIKDSTLEVNKCINTIEKLCEDDLLFLKSRIIHSIYNESTIKHQALGVIYSIMPWNFPVWQLIRMSIPALLSGNTILLKHSEITPGVGALLHELFQDLFELPLLINAYINHDKTELVLQNSNIGGVSLTGSISAGKIVSHLASKYFKKCVLELGGSDPYIVYDDADLEMTAKKIAKGRLNNSGQVCIAVKRAIVQNSIKLDFLNLLKNEFDKYKIGDPSDPKTDLGPLASYRFKKNLKNQISNLRANTDATLEYKIGHEFSEDSAFVDLEIYSVSNNMHWLKDQEFFSPTLLVISFDRDEQAIKLANSTDFALGAGVFSSNKSRSIATAEAIVAGQVAINNLISTDLTLPFGGFKNSGIGRELGREGYFEFTQTKVISVS